MNIWSGKAFRMGGILDVDAGRSARDGRAVGRGMNRFAVEMRPDIEREAGSGRRRSAAVSSSRNLVSRTVRGWTRRRLTGGQPSAYQTTGK
jgi:hypothetical protein